MGCESHVLSRLQNESSITINFKNRHNVIQINSSPTSSVTFKKRNKMKPANKQIHVLFGFQILFVW